MESEYIARRLRGDPTYGLRGESELGTVRGDGPASLRQGTENGPVLEAIKFAESIANLLENNNGLVEVTVNRLVGPQIEVLAGGGYGLGVPTPNALVEGELGNLMDVLQRVWTAACTYSTLAGRVGRL